MANIRSQIKRNRQNNKRRLANRVYRGEARVAIKNARVAIELSSPEVKEDVKKAISALDKAAIKGVIHKNNAARRKSRLMKALLGMKPVEVKDPIEETSLEEKKSNAPRIQRTARSKAVTKKVPELREQLKTVPTKKASTTKKTDQSGKIKSDQKVVVKKKASTK